MKNYVTSKALLYKAFIKNVKNNFSFYKNIS